MIVESPSKAKTISKYLGGEYEVLASVGHIKDLPKKDLGVEGKPCHGFRAARNEDLFDENPYHGKEHLRHADIQTTTQHYTSEKKPAGLINSLNKTTKKRHSVSS